MSSGGRPAFPRSLHPPITIAAAVSALALAVLSMIYAAGGALGEFDQVEPAQEGIGPPLRSLALAIDFLGEPVGAAVLVGTLVAVCLALRRPRSAVLAVLGPGLVVATTTALKQVVGRTIHGDNLSFPSGHTALLTAVAMVAAFVAVDALTLGPLAGTLLVLVAAVVAGGAMAWAQVSLGAHYSTDTLAGFYTAVAVVPAAAWLVDRVSTARSGATRSGGRRA